MTASAEKQQPHLVVDSERPGAGVGAILRGARLARDEDLREVASALRIRLPYLQALEDGDVSALPGVTYGIGFVRAYAAYLDLNVEETVARFKSEVSGIHRRTQLSFPEPLPGNRVPGGALLLIVLILAGAVYGGWLYTSSQNMSFTEAVEQVPQRLMALLKQEDEVAPTTADSQATDPAAAVNPTVGGQQAAEEPTADAAAPSETAAVAEPTADAAPAMDETATGSDADPVPATETATAPAVSAPTESAPETPSADAQVAEPAATIPEEAPATETQPSETAPAPEATTEATPEPSAEPESAITVEELPNPPAAPEPPTASPPSTEAEMTDQAAATTASTAEPEAPVSSSAAEEQVAEATTTDDVAAPATTAPEVAAEPSTPSRIIVQATSDSWIQVTDAGGSVVYEQLMLTGDIYRVPDRDGLKLTTGNAGALKIVVDGTTIPPIGESGEVRRDIALTPDALKP
ncbi:DUF4115 domain-containing protein [Rhodospirillaceae bacterium KN72]|uniref:DUF4115 domain-containing protein n=1 Tax=Pacificispira spongiicola TaxID=2729598 RepID=A0A7Y0DY69_9PROT|nr:helix-turn-helix domain-containing protein [Pacificispira spongiicola]NMM43787.1 DUF4115 domain-containing protein [Pacificispira spongiicola]